MQYQPLHMHVCLCVRVCVCVTVRQVHGAALRLHTGSDRSRTSDAASLRENNR